MALVWYAAYGSNLDGARLRCYLSGGRPPGGGRVHPGCRDHTPPREDRPLVLPFTLYFGGRSTVWGGGAVAFVDPEPDPAAGTLARGWLIEQEQLADLLAQERGRLPGDDVVPFADLGAMGSLTLGTGWYEHVLLCGAIDGRPVVTFTSAQPVPVGRPHRSYLDRLVAGLVESHGLTAEEAEAYLEARIP